MSSSTRNCDVLYQNVPQIHFQRVPCDIICRLLGNHCQQISDKDGDTKLCANAVSLKKCQRFCIYGAISRLPDAVDAKVFISLPPSVPDFGGNNTEAVLGRTLTNSRDVEVMLSRQILPSRKIHQQRGKKTPILAVIRILSTNNICSTSPTVPMGRSD